MSIGLPSYLAVGTVSRSFVRALHVIALVALVASAMSTVLFQLDRPGAVLWPAVVALAPMTGMLLLLRRSRLPILSVVYLLLGTAGVYVYTLSYTASFDRTEIEAGLLVSFPMIALLCVGSSFGGAFAVLATSTAGYVLSQLAAAAAYLQNDGTLRLDAMTTVAYLALAAVVLVAWQTGRGGYRVQTRLQRAVREDVAFGLRHRIEAKATALIHDTMLNHLAVVAASAPGPIGTELREQVEHDLTVLQDDEWLSVDRLPVHLEGDTDWQSSELFQAIKSARSQGLNVDATGDTAAVLDLDDERASALGLAVRQCLINVIKHSGKADAEVAVHASGDELLVMVIDAGRGFDVKSVGHDRFGLRNSVSERIEGVGGYVQVWSTPGQGTSVVIRVPIDGTAQHDALPGEEGHEGERENDDTDDAAYDASRDPERGER